MASIRSDVKQLKRFYSKRNQVHLCSDGQSEFVVKTFMDMTHYHTERRVYRKMKGLGLSPELLNWSDELQSLELSYVEGITVLEALEHYESQGLIEEAVLLLVKLLKWLEAFYGLVHTDEGQMVYHDINLRNFIVQKEQIIGIDFECCDYGDLRYELVKVMAMFLRYDPMDSDFKQTVVHLLYETYYKDQGYLHAEFLDMISKETEIILKRRTK